MNKINNLTKFYTELKQMIKKTLNRDSILLKFKYEYKKR